MRAKVLLATAATLVAFVIIFLDATLALEGHGWPPGVPLSVLALPLLAAAHRLLPPTSPVPGVPLAPSAAVTGREVRPLCLPRPRPPAGNEERGVAHASVAGGRARRCERALAGLAFFWALSFSSSWFVAAALRVLGFTAETTSLGPRLFATSLLFALTMGWQPLVAVWAVRRWVDPSDAPGLGLRRAPWSFTVVGGVAALGVTALAALVAALAAALGLGSAPLLHGDATAGFAADVRPAWALASLALTFFGTLVLVWAQSLAEEVAWRGYVLPRMMERLGAWRGLVSHGAAWGLWYAPVLFFATYEPLAPSTSLGRSAGFVLTCVLLGTLLGWLRLAARSLVPAVVTNAVLTLAAGLPSFVHGLDAGLRSAALGPAGWLVLLATIGGLSLSRWRSAVRPPPPLAPLSGVRPAPHALVVILPPGAALPNRHLN